MNNNNKQKVRNTQKRKAANPDAVGDGGIFSEEIVAHAKKPKNESTDAPVKSRYVLLLL